jgi:16S rRNA processing protein RimM
MQVNDCFQLGHIVKSHGFKGELISELDVDSPSFYAKLKEIYIEVNNKLVRFDIEKVKILEKQQALIKLSGIDDEETATALSGANLFLPLSYLPPLSDTQFYFHEIIGYEVIDKEKGLIGLISRVLDMPQQAILEIKNSEEKEILIPITNETITRIDREKKQLFINAPEGLIDIYLS